jgi:hypothetical protein
MMRAGIVTGVLIAVAGQAHGKAPPEKALPRLPPPRVWVKPARPLPMLPSVARVRVEAARDRVVVLEEVSFPRGDWVSGGLDLHVAFGAPGTPIAVDAQLGVAAPGTGEARGEEPGEPVTVEPVAGRVGGAQPLLGRPQMAGVVVRVKESQLRHAYAASEVATLRVRSLLAAPAADPGGRRDVVVRLGAPGGTPLTLGRIQVVSLEPRAWITRVEASLCGAEADPWPLTVSLLPKAAAARPAPGSPPIAPAMAVRHASDDLCVRWWATDQ